jgi:hypothetical protein
MERRNDERDPRERDGTDRESDSDSDSNSSDSNDDDFFEEEEVDSDGEPLANAVEVDVLDFEAGLNELEIRGARAAQGAAAAAQGARPLSFGKVTLLDPDYAGTAERDQDATRRSFARFVTLLERYGGGSGGSSNTNSGIRIVTFRSVRFNEPGFSFHESDQARLFGQVLPNLPHLERLRFFACSLPADDFLQLVLRLSSPGGGRTPLAAAAAPLRELHVDFCRGGMSGPVVPALASMIGRNIPSTLRIVKLYPDTMLDRSECRQMFEGVRRSVNLRSLEVRVKEAYGDALLLPNRPLSSSSLRVLVIHLQEFTQEGLNFLAQQLKTNTLLEKVSVFHATTMGTLDHMPWIDMLTTHNFTLRTLQEGSNVGPWSDRDLRSAEIDLCLRRNKRIRKGLLQLRGTYHVSPPALLPLVLEVVKTLPTLLYRFVRRGDINALGDRLLLVATAHRQRQPRGGGGTSNNNNLSAPPPRRRRTAREKWPRA